jgi:hypothetical protein
VGGHGFGRGCFGCGGVGGNSGCVRDRDRFGRGGRFPQGKKKDHARGQAEENNQQAFTHLDVKILFFNAYQKL